MKGVYAVIHIAIVEDVKAEACLLYTSDAADE